MPFIRTFLVAGLVPVVLAYLLGAYLQPLGVDRADLARVGEVSERSWGWNTAIPYMEPLPPDTSPTAKVIVLGDSFSMANLWQSVAQEGSGLGFATYHWDSLPSPGCVRQAMRVLKRNYPAARFVIIESVERHFVARFSTWKERESDCPESLAPARMAPRSPSATREPKYRKKFDLNNMPDPIYALHALRFEAEPYTHTETSGQAHISPLIRSDLFSNRRSDHLLYLSTDLLKRDWTLEQMAMAMANIQTFCAAARELGLQPLMLIIPDKLTVYAPYLLEQPAVLAPVNIWNVMQESGIPSVPLGPIFAREVTRHVDLYFPDDTHIGTEAQILIGQEVLGYMASSGPRGY